MKGTIVKVYPQLNFPFIHDSCSVSTCLIKMEQPLNDRFSNRVHNGTAVFGIVVEPGSLKRCYDIALKINMSSPGDLVEIDIDLWHNKSKYNFFELVDFKNLSQPIVNTING